VAIADESEDPREVAWHPRHAETVVGHAEAQQAFISSFASGRPHHAWLMTGGEGIGKATLAYQLARHVLSQSMKAEQVDRWIKARAHPDLIVLERTLNDSKPRKLRAEISVDDVRRFIDFFARTSGSGGWRVGIVDAADDLNTESANALLKLVEEPPNKTLILLVCHKPGRLLRTVRSRCRRLALNPLGQDETLQILQSIPLDEPVKAEKLAEAASISSGAPGRALALLNSEGAKAFYSFTTAKRMDQPTRNIIGQHFATRASAVQDYEVFMELLLGWVAGRANHGESQNLATLHAELGKQQNIVSGYNLDRRTAIMDALSQVDHALKEA
jgi:DNA polymerase III subunit delta'